MAASIPPHRDPDEYPRVIQGAGTQAMRLFDQVIAGLISDGFTPEEADMLAHLNVDQILAKVSAPSTSTESGQ